MYREEAIKKLKNYSRIKHQQEFLNIQLRALEERYSHLPPGCEDKPAKLSAINRLKSVYNSNREYMEFIENCLSCLSERERVVLWHFYVERTYDYIEIINEKLHIERSQIYRLKDKALRTFAMLSQGDFY